MEKQLINTWLNWKFENFEHYKKNMIWYAKAWIKVK